MGPAAAGKLFRKLSLPCPRGWEVWVGVPSSTCFLVGSFTPGNSVIPLDCLALLPHPTTPAPGSWAASAHFLHIL